MSPLCLVTMLHLQSGGEKLSYPGEAEQAEDLDEAQELHSLPALPDAAGSGPHIRLANSRSDIHKMTLS